MDISVTLSPRNLELEKTPFTISLLMVEDDCDDSDIVQEALHNISPKYKLLCINRSEKAMAYLNALSPEEHPALIILDLNMPVVPGMDLLATIKGHSKFKQTPVVIYTTSSYAKYREQAMELGACAYFTKKGTLADVEADLREIVTYCKITS